LTAKPMTLDDLELIYTVKFLGISHDFISRDFADFGGKNG